MYTDAADATEADAAMVDAAVDVTKKEAAVAMITKKADAAAKEAAVAIRRL